jgi:hypothetical protein
MRVKREGEAEEDDDDDEEDEDEEAEEEEEEEAALALLMAVTFSSTVFQSLVMRWGCLRRIRALLHESTPPRMMVTLLNPATTPRREWMSLSTSSLEGGWQ